MGGGNSKLESARARLEAEQQHHADTVAQNREQMQRMEKLIADRDKYYREEGSRMQASWDARITTMTNDRREMENNYQRIITESANATREERQKREDEYIKLCKDKEAAIAKAREEQKQEEMRLKEEHEKEKEKIEAQLAAEKEKREKEKEAYDLKVEAKNQEIRALERNVSFLHIAGIQNQYQYAARFIGALHNVAAVNNNEKEADKFKAEVQALIDAISKLEKNRRKVVEWIIEAKIKNMKTGTFSKMDEAAQFTLKMMAEDTKALEDKISSDITLIEEASFAREFIEEAKRLLNEALEITPALYTEIGRVRIDIMESPLTVSLDAIEKHLKELKKMINNIPPLPIHSTQKYLQEEMERFAIQNQQEMNNLMTNAIAAGVENLPALEVPSSFE